MITLPNDSGNERKNRFWLILALGGLFVFALFLFGENNRFSYLYHPDEPVKVEQILSGERTFYHPLLMLTTADWASSLLGAKTDLQQIVIVGRWCTAFFAAAAVVMLSLLAYRWSGWWGVVFCGLFLTTNPQLYELAHYFKEDPALVMGLAAAFLAADFYQAQPSRFAALATGAATGLALSGKYIGVVVLLFILPIIVVKAPGKPWRMLGFFLIGLGLMWACFNYPALQNFSKMHAGLSREIAKTDSPELANSRFLNLDFLQRVKHLTPPLAWVGLATLPILWMAGRKRISLVQSLCFLFPVAYLLMLLFWPKSSDRYVLPVTIFFIANSIAGLVWLMTESIADKKFGVGLALATLCGYLVFSSDTIREARESFQLDQRAELRLWLTANLPPEAAFATDKVIHLGADKNWASRKVLTGSFTVADLDTVVGLRKKGITHVIVSPRTAEKYLSESTKRTQKKADAKDSRRLVFFQDLLAQSHVIWSKKSLTSGYLSPGMTVYEFDR